MEKVTSGRIEMTWDPKARLAVIRFARETRATGNDARVLINALSNWIGTDRTPFGLLGDGGRLASLDAGYRAAWGKFFRQHRQESCLSFFDMGPVMRVAAEMFRLGTGVRMKAFADEADARAWLRSMGISA